MDDFSSLSVPRPSVTSSCVSRRYETYRTTRPLFHEGHLHAEGTESTRPVFSTLAGTYTNSVRKCVLDTEDEFSKRSRLEEEPVERLNRVIGNGSPRKSLQRQQPACHGINCMDSHGKMISHLRYQLRVIWANPWRTQVMTKVQNTVKTANAALPTLSPSLSYRKVMKVPIQSIPENPTE